MCFTDSDRRKIFDFQYRSTALRTGSNVYIMIYLFIYLFFTLDIVELQAKTEVLSEKPDPVTVLSIIIHSQTAMGLRPSLCWEKPVA